MKNATTNATPTPKPTPKPTPEQLDALLDSADEMALAATAWRRFADEITEARRRLARLEQKRGTVMARLGTSRLAFETAAAACGFDWEAALAAVAQADGKSDVKGTVKVAA
jgi:hypothetical protein